MPSIMQRALGDDFRRLHPQIQKQYQLTSEQNTACLGEGVMSRIWRGRFHVVPFLRLGATRRVMFPETGTDVPFTIANYAYVDRFGRETLTWTRSFQLPTPRRFDETLIYSERRKCPIVYAGTHQHLAVELKPSVGDNGAFLLRTGAQRLYEWRMGIRFPLLFSGVADVCESYNDALERFEVTVTIAHPIWGRIFGYDGWFRLKWEPCRREEIPIDVIPVREERRE